MVGFECLYGLKHWKRKDGSMAIKLDMSKAYNRVEWCFIEQMMAKLGFSDNWINKIIGCVKSISYSLIINGEVVSNLKPTSGLRQGDPISPYMFLMCTEGLLCLLNKANLDQSISGYKSSRFGLVITHLFFTDDSLLFSRATVSYCEGIGKVLKDYALASDQVVNYAKSIMCLSPSVG
ncbi:hypothetical protein Dsin_008875 [Dipteronia sinensis]|uniref:Reverse transcriptase domain-containing protein n=1 Tax=Dipteronia sinensis TaxID=43782 RepID=A0AAE0AQE4_9ROSI|nr:hypothetical protein Dsin_008875 [Dipteronia sinensis]